MYGKLSTETIAGICFSKALKLFWPAAGATKTLGAFEKQVHDETKAVFKTAKKPMQSNYSDQSQLAQSAGKIARSRCDWF